ncbi:MAG: DUF4158 domain-containing protein [Proteobacteria bacterium]|nr:DUF4158 domain-containing protein [Pseudomonadota bacterium]
MTVIHETAYPRIKPIFSAKELQELFTPTEDKVALLNKYTRKTQFTSRLSFMVTLKRYQYLGRPIEVIKVGEVTKKTIAGSINIPYSEELNHYSLTSRKRHLTIIRNFLKIHSN